MIYRAAVIGLGKIGWQAEQDPVRPKPASHVGAWQNLPGQAELVGAADADPGRLAEFLGTVSEGVICSTGVDPVVIGADIVSVATPPSTHRLIVEACAAAKVRLVICEKPLALTSKDALAMVEACEASGTILLVNHWRRFEPGLRGAQACLQDRIGMPTRVAATYCQGLWTGGTHMVDVLSWFFGEVGWVSGWSAGSSNEDGTEDGADMVLWFRNGVRAMVTSLDIRSYVEFSLTIHGTKGAFEVDAYGLHTRWWGTDDFYPLASGYRRRILSSGQGAASVSPLARMAEHAVNVLDGVETPCSTGRDGLAAVQILAAVERSVATHGSPIVPGTA